MRKLEFVFLVFWVLQACSGSMITSTYSEMMGVRGGSRTGAHAGVEMRDKQGAPVLAAMDGNVVWAGDTQLGCGKGVSLSHTIVSPKGSRFTLYCHLDGVDVSPRQSVRRGERIGRVGTTGDAFGVPHIHFEASSVARAHPDGDLRDTEDPEPYFAGCFDPQQIYPTDKFLLTYPVQCTK